jgi:hypothetical protein
VIALSAAAGPPVRVQVHPARLTCGGPDDLSYVPSDTTEQLTLASNADVRVLVFGGAGPEDRRISPSRLVAWLRHDRTGRIFRVAGPLASVTAMTEMYHP